MRTLSRSLRSVALTAALSAAACGSFATTTALSIVSDGSWWSSATLQPNWATPGFDDSAWSSARASYPSITPVSSLISGSSAQMMWHDPTGVSNGSTGAIETWYRRSFTVDLSDSNLVSLGQAIVFADDDFEFYVNGSLVYVDGDGGAPSTAHFVDFTPYLISGSNVLAIHAVDGALSGPYDRLYEYVLVDAIVLTVSAVPEPATIAPLLVGLSVVSTVARRRSLTP